MAAGDIIIPDNMITPEIMQKIAAEVTKLINTNAKDPGQWEVVTSTAGIASLPVFQVMGATYKLVRVAISTLQGVNGREVELQMNAEKTAIQWRYVSVSGSDLQPTEWRTLIEVSLLKGDPGETPEFRQAGAGLEWKYKTEGEDAWRVLVSIEILKLKFSDLTDENVAEFWRGVPDNVMAEFQKPAIEAAYELNKVKTAFEEFSKITVLAESNRVKAEEQRVRIEGLRVDAEEARAAAETARKSAEALREDSEALRDQTETERINAETARKEAETNRVLIEGLRVDEEAKRAAAELIRIQSEQGRVTEEGKRVEVEKDRVAAETLRDQSEKKRDEAEGLRDQAESARVSEEVDRDTAEQERIIKETERDKAEQERISAETTRNDREDGRIVEEQLRKNAELARQETEAGRATAEEEREQNTIQAILDTEDATKKSKAATAITLDLNAHPMKIMGGIWFEWNVVDQEYKNTGIQAKGDVGASFKIIGRYDTLDELKEAVPDGTNVDGVYAVGAIEPFDYYAWLAVDGVWQWDNQGKLRGAEGKSSYEVWTEYPENEGKSKDEYFDWLSPVIDPTSGRWIVQGEDKGVQAKAIDAHVTIKDNKPDTYILHVKSAAGEFDTPNLHGFDVKVEEVESNTPDDYKLKITTVAGTIITPNLQGRSGSAVIDIDHEPTQADTHYTYNDVQYAFSVGDEVRWYDADNEEYVLFKLYAVTAGGATWEELGSGGVSLPTDVFLDGPSSLSADEANSYIFLDNGYLKGEE